MECMEARALKPSLRRELAMKSSQQVLLDDLLCLNGPNFGVSSSEDLSVECFLDLSNGKFEYGSIVEEEEEESSQERLDDDNNSNSCSVSSDSFLTSELSVPADDIAELEWVSHFVDDSLPELSLLFPAGKMKTENHQKPRPEPELVGPVLVKRSCFSSTVPVKARTKRTRTRTTGWVCSLGSLSLTETSIASTTTTSSSSSGFNSTPCLLFTNMVQNMEEAERRRKKKPTVQPDGLSFQRRCSHCQVQKTPQWRTGPLGAKTLCNACGVRYKSGRLFPEYRPARSPTFLGDVHSNSHRKVLELRKQRESVEPASSADQNDSEVIEAF